MTSFEKLPGAIQHYIFINLKGEKNEIIINWVIHITKIYEDVF